MDKTAIKIRAAIVTKDYLNAAAQLLWPAKCALCGEPINQTDNYLCRCCWNDLIANVGDDYCPSCGLSATPYTLINNKCPVCLEKDFSFDSICRPGLYSGSLRSAILKFKNDSMGHLNTLLAKLALDASGVSDLQSIDFFVPVPLHWTRKLRRGYNQAELLAQALSPCRSKVNTDLVRVKRTRPQPAMVSDRKRAANVAGAFAVRKRHDFSDKRICLVDDIKTSGATLNECATTLKNVGAAEVCAIVLAVAERR